MPVGSCGAGEEVRREKHGPAGRESGAIKKNATMSVPISMTQPSAFPRRAATLVMGSETDEPRSERSSGAILILRIGSEQCHVASAAMRIRSVCMRGPFKQEDVDDIELCAREALTNVIEHAYRGRAEHHIDIVVLCSSSSVVVELADEGISVEPALIETDPGALSDNLIAEIGGLAERGRGLSILHALMDVIRYRASGGRNVLSMTRRVGSTKGG